MKTKGQITKMADSLYATAKGYVATLAENMKDTVKGIDTANADAGIVTVQSILTSIDTCMNAPTEEGFSFPKHISKIKYGDDLTSFILSVSSRQKAATKVKREFTIKVDDTLVAQMGDALINTLLQMFYIEVANENVADLNEKLADLCKTNGIPYTFGFHVDAESDKLLYDITDDVVIFNADISKAHDIASISLFLGDSSYDEMVRQNYEEALINTLKTAQTTVQLIKTKVQLIADVTGQKTKKKASKLIRDVYHRNAHNLDQAKTCTAYFDEQVGDDNIFAAVAKDESGEIRVILSPFNTETNEKVDFDVVKAIKAF